MEQSIQVAIAAVRKYIFEADDSQAHIVFFNRHGEIDIVSGTITEDETFIELMDEARTRSGGPYFEILSILVGGTIIVQGDDSSPNCPSAPSTTKS